MIVLGEILQASSPIALIILKGRLGGVAEQARGFFQEQESPLKPPFFVLIPGLLLTSVSTRGWLLLCSFLFGKVSIGTGSLH